MAYLKTLNILEILEDFYNDPLYEGEGKWNDLRNVVGDIKDNSLSGILVFSRLNEMFISFYDSGVMLEGLSISEDNIYSYGYEEFIRRISSSAKVKAYNFKFYPHNSDIIIVISLIHKSSRIMDSMTPEPQKVFEELKDIGFSGILRIYSPIQVSCVLISGVVFGAFSRGKTMNINEILFQQGIYEIKAFSVDEPMSERNYEYYGREYARKINKIYSKMLRSHDSLPTKFRYKMIEFSQNEPLLDPILGLVEPTEKGINIHLPPYPTLKALISICDILSALNPRLEEIQELKEELEKIL